MSCKIIAEIGWNHMGDMNLAKEMISAAAESGADYAKFQTWSVANLKDGPWNADGRLEIYKKAELSRDQHADLMEYCNAKNIQFLTSIFNINDAQWLSEVCGHAIKIPSHEIYNSELIKEVDGKFESLFVSTGAARWSEVEMIPQIIEESDCTLLHCVSAYPCSFENINLPRIRALRELSPSVGYSGHLFGIEDAIAALSYDIDLIEKHFTIDRTLPGRDNENAILPEEMKTLTDYSRSYFSMNIDKGREFQNSELDVVENYRGRWSK